MFTDEEIHTVHSTCAPGSTSDRMCHAAMRVMQERDALRTRLAKYERITAAVEAQPAVKARHRFLAWLLKD